MSITSRWADIKQRCKKCDNNSTGLYNHFKDSCPHDTGSNKQTIIVSLIDYMNTTVGKLRDAGHKKGNCKCSECDTLRKQKNTWILRLGNFFGESGLNARNILDSTVRVNY